MTMLRVAFVTHEEGLQGKSVDFEVKENPTKADGYFIQEIDEPTFFNGRAAAIYVRLGGKLQRIGELGVLHPTVLEKFDLRYVMVLGHTSRGVNANKFYRYPVSTLEINLEVFL
jgi:phenylalanyl-tRNA synthetase beta chain